MDNPQGEETCLGIAMVDEAVLSLGDPMDKKPADYFYDPQLKTLAGKGKATLLWPVLDRNWGYPHSDMAYPQQGWKAPRGMCDRRKRLKGEKLDMELVFVLDTTGSMGQMLCETKAKIQSVVNIVASVQPTPMIKIALVAYRALGDEYVTRITSLSTDLDSVYTKLTALRAEGGGEEKVNQALADAINQISWSSGKRAIKMTYLIGDEPPNMEGQKETYRTICVRARQRNITIHTIRCGMNAEVKRHWQEIASLAGGRYITAVPQTKILSELDGKLCKLHDRLNATIVAGPGYREKLMATEQKLTKAIGKDLSWAERAIYKCKTADDFFLRRRRSAHPLPTRP